jgi:hypothetical protein
MDGEHCRVAVGSEAFVTAMKKGLGLRAEGRAVIGCNGTYELREPRRLTRVFLAMKMRL